MKCRHARTRTFDRHWCSFVKKLFKSQYGRIPINPAILVSIGHMFNCTRQCSSMEEPVSWLPATLTVVRLWVGYHYMNSSRLPLPGTAAKCTEALYKLLGVVKKELDLWQRLSHNALWQAGQEKIMIHTQCNRGYRDGYGITDYVTYTM